MAGLQRFISYIYRYENDEKTANAGFAKVEVRGGICRMEVHIRGIAGETQEGMVYLFFRKEGKMCGIPVGGIAVVRGNGDVRYSFEIRELAEYYAKMEQMEGIYILFSDRLYLASQWKEGIIKQTAFKIMEKGELPEEVEESPIIHKKEEPMETEKDLLSEKSVMQDIAVEEDAELEGTIHTTEIPQEEYQMEEGWERVFQKFRMQREIFFPFEGKQMECVRLEVKDIKAFPEKYWYLGNNSFLLHGFFNYGHFILGENLDHGKKEYFIGVPGVFLNQERIMASMFGFPEFQTAKDAQYKTGNFGYWYRII